MKYTSALGCSRRNKPRFGAPPYLGRGDNVDSRSALEIRDEARHADA